MDDLNQRLENDDFDGVFAAVTIGRLAESRCFPREQNSPETLESNPTRHLVRDYLADADSGGQSPITEAARRSSPFSSWCIPAHRRDLIRIRFV